MPLGNKFIKKILIFCQNRSFSWNYFKNFQIQTQKIEIKAQSKIGSLDNVKHKPGGGEKKIFDDKDYLKNIEHGVPITTPPAQVTFEFYSVSLHFPT